MTSASDMITAAPTSRKQAAAIHNSEQRNHESARAFAQWAKAVQHAEHDFAMLKKNVSARR